MYKKKLLTSILFLAAGILLFWIVYREFDIAELKKSLRDIKYGWIFISISFGLISHYVRAIRWRMLIETMNYKAGTLNLFLSVIVLYFTNLIIPRGGEVSRCAVIAKYERIPFIKLVGTVFIERITDFFAFVVIFVILLIWQSDFFLTIFSYPEFRFDSISLKEAIIPVIMISALIVLLILGLKRFKIFGKINRKLKQFKQEFIEGISVILHMKKRILFIILTLTIFLFWLLMLYSVFFAYPPTRSLTFMVAALTYTFGTLAYLLPIQAGMGAWHFIVMSCLFFYGVDKESGLIFALIAHTFTNLIFLLFGPIAMAFLPFVNSRLKEEQVVVV